MTIRVSRFFASTAVLALACVGLTHSAFGAPVVVQPAGEISHDLQALAPPKKDVIRSKSEISAALTAIAEKDAPVDQNVVLAPKDELTRLKAMPVTALPLHRAKLITAVTALAEEANMRYIAPSESDFAERISVNVRLNPKEMLDTLAETYGFGMEYDEHGVWHFFKLNNNEPVTKFYTLRFSNLIQVDISAPSINSSLAAVAGGMPAGSPQAGGGGSQSRFKVDATGLIAALKAVAKAPTTFGGIREYSQQNDGPGRLASMPSSDSPEPQISWDRNSNQLLVIATRQQQGLIGKYIQMIDRPQQIIRLAVKFIETTRDPKQSLGLDWSGMPVNGGAISLSGSSAVGSALSTAPINLNHPGSVISLPSAILSTSSFQMVLNAFATDHFSSLVQDPVLVTSNNQPVTFKATTQQPVQQSSTNIGTSTTSSTAQIIYLEVGPEISVLPIVLPGSTPDRPLVQLFISIVTSQITGQTSIGGNPYPIISSKTYEYSVPVENGNTLAIAGLDQRTRTVDSNKVPIFGDLPVIGAAFSSKTNETITSTLMAFITPTVESSVFESSIGPVPASARRIFQGSPSETLADLRRSLSGLNVDILTLRSAANDKNREEVVNRLDRIGVELSLMEVRLEEWRLDKKVKIDPDLLLVKSDRRVLEDARTAVTRISPNSG